MFARGSPRATAPCADPGGMLPAPGQEDNGTDSAPVLPDLGSELYEEGSERALMIRAIREILGVEKGPNGAVLGSFFTGCVFWAWFREVFRVDDTQAGFHCSSSMILKANPVNSGKSVILR